jgi:predicted nucleic acid-binding Zn ribbon protein
MFGKSPKCIVCHKTIEKGEEIKKYQSYFCSADCLKKYEKILEKAKKEVNLDDCC